MQERLPALLRSADVLKIKGLSGSEKALFVNISQETPKIDQPVTCSRSLKRPMSPTSPKIRQKRHVASGMQNDDAELKSELIQVRIFFSYV